MTKDKKKKRIAAKAAKTGAAAMARQTHGRKTKFEDKKKAENKKRCRKKDNGIVPYDILIRDYYA